MRSKHTEQQSPFLFLMFAITIWGMLVCLMVWSADAEANRQREERNDRQAEAQHEELAGSRSGKWPSFRAAYLRSNPRCAGCGTTLGVQVHHIKPFSERPDLELDVTNVISLCGPDSPDNCHLRIGHDLDGPFNSEHRPNYKTANPNVVRDAMLWNDYLHSSSWTPRDGPRPKSMPARRGDREFDSGPEFGFGSWAQLDEDGIWRRYGG